MARFIPSLLWVGGGQFVSALIFLAGLRLITTHVPTATFGNFATQLAIVGLAYSGAIQPLVQSFSRFGADAVARGHDLHPTSILGSRLWRTAMFGLLATAGMTVAYWTFDQSHSLFLLVTSSALLLLSDAWRGFRITQLSAERRHREASILAVSEALGKQCGALVAVAIYHPTLECLIAGYAVGSAAANMINAQFALEGRAMVRVVQDSDVAAYIRPLYLLSAFSWLGLAGDRIWIPRLTSAAELGLYAAASGLISRPILLFANAALQTIRAELFEAATLRNRPEFARLLRIALLAVAACGGTAIVITATFSEYVAAFFLGPAFARASELMTMVATAYFLVTLSYVFNTASLAFKRSKSVLISEATGAITGALFSVGLTWLYGIRGAALAVALLGAVQLGVGYYLYRINLAKTQWDDPVSEKSSS